MRGREGGRLLLEGGGGSHCSLKEKRLTLEFFHKAKHALFGTRKRNPFQRRERGGGGRHVRLQPPKTRTKKGWRFECVQKSFFRSEKKKETFSTQFEKVARANYYGGEDP